MNLNIFHPQSLKTRITLVILSIFLICIWSLAFLASRVLHDDMERLVGSQQLSTASFMAATVNDELESRFSALKMAAAGIDPVMMDNRAGLQKYIERRLIFKTLFNGGAFVNLVNGITIADVPLATGRIGMNHSDRTWMIDTLNGKPAIGRPVMGEKLRMPIFTMAVPILDPKGKVIGVLAGVTNLGIPNFLDNVANKRYGSTGDYYLVSLQYRQIITSSDKRRIMEILPSPGKNRMLDRFIEGYEGSLILTNTLGVEMLSSAKRVPVADWYVVVTLATSEAFAPIHEALKRLLIITVFLTLLAGVVTYWLLRRELSPMLSAAKTLSDLSETNVPFQPLPITRQDEIGQLIGGFNRLIDILWKRQKALRQSEERHRQLFEQATEGILIIDTNGNIIAINNAYAKMHGYTADEISKFTLQDFDAEDQSNLFPERMKRVIDGEVLNFEVAHYHKDGHIFPLDIDASSIELGEKKYALCFHRDITERKEAEKAMLKNATLLRRAEGLAGFGNWEAHLSENRMLASEGACTIYGVETGGALRLTDVQSMVLPEYRPMLDTALKDLIEKGTEYKVEYSIRRFSDDKIIDIQSIAEYDSGENVVFGVIQDVTERKASERFLVEIEYEKGKLQDQLIQSQKMQAIGQLAGGVAHDFNNILSAIVSFSYLLTKRIKDDPRGSEYISEIQLAADRAASLTQSLLAFSRKQHSNPQPIDLNLSIQNTEKILARTIGEDIQLSLQLTDQNTAVLADSNQIAQVLMNLATNARDAMPKGGALTIKTDRVVLDETFMKMHGYGRSGDYVLMTITDSGFGMDAATRQRAFEPFFTTKEIGKGTGLGLSMAYGIVKQHEGFIDIYSEIGEGTVFRIYLPALDTRAEDLAVNGYFEQEGATETILVVEDDSILRGALTEMLQFVGHSVIAAVNGDDAITKYVAHKDEIHLVLMDVLMPHKNGADAYKELRTINPEVKIILMSGYAGDYLSGKLNLEDDVHFIPKPVSPKELFETIRSVLK